MNFGHTIGHAIEKLSDFQLIHGYCVSIGVAAGSHLSARRGLIFPTDEEMIYHVLKDFKLPIKAAFSDADQVLKTTKLDKKMESGKVKFILLNRPGEAIIDKSVTDDELLEAIEFIREA